MPRRGSDKSRLHRIWSGMISRCQDRGNSVFRNYGARGIAVTPGWKEYSVFQEWALANNYAADLELDRKRNDDGYQPDNCRWITHSANCRNTRRNVIVDAFGEAKTAIEWAEDPRCPVAYSTLLQRVQKYGWSAERAILTPITMYMRGCDGIGRRVVIEDPR